MQPDQCHPRTQLFTVRLWLEPYGDNQQEMRMQVQHVLSGETRYFQDWPMLVTYLLAKLQPRAGEPRAEAVHPNAENVVC
jgi:hypothetical protein